MTVQLTKLVLDLIPGDVFYKGENKFTVEEVEEVSPRPMLCGESVVNVDCVAILLQSGNLVGWDHFPIGDTVCMISPSQYEAMKTSK